MLRARSIAFFGGRSLASGVEYLKAMQFDGDIWLVNPSGWEVAGVRSFRSLAELPSVPDASVIGTRPEVAAEVVAQLAEAGAPGAVLYTAGFAEVGPEGRALQERVAEAAGSMALIGPNCTGFTNFFDGVAATVVNHGFSRPKAGVGIVAQSGTIAHNATMSARSLPIGYSVSVGNQACLDTADLVEAFLDDSRVNAIGVYVEEISNPTKFSAVALRALEASIPIVAFKGGISAAGQQAALSHTASLSGANEAYDAYFRSFGILRASTFEQFLETLKLLSVGGIPTGDRIAFLTCSGMEAMMSADLAEHHGISIPQPSSAQTATLRQLLPKLAAVANPVDYTMAIWGKEEPQRQIFAEFMRETYDATALVANYPAAEYGDPSDWDAATNAFISAKRETGRPGYFIGSLPEGVPAEVRQRLCDAGIPPLQGLDDAMASIGLCLRYRDLRAAARKSPLSNRTFRESPARQTLDEWTGKQRLAAAGLAIPRGSVVRPQQARAVAGQLGFPVVAKAVGADIAHKSDAGLVKLNLRSPEEVDRAVETLARQHPASRDKVLIEEMITDAVAELIVGSSRDPLFGPLLLIGSGGVFAEIVRDTATLLLPTTAEEVRRALAGLSCYPLMNGFRGRPVADLDALVAAVLAMADFVDRASYEIVELDVNPILVRPVGKGVVAADALLVVSVGAGPTATR